MEEKIFDWYPSRNNKNAISYVFLRYRRHKPILKTIFEVKIFSKNVIYMGKNMREIDWRPFLLEKIMSRSVIFEKIAIFRVF